MSDLQRLKAELELQDRAFAECFEQLRQVDPDVEIALSPEWMAEFPADPSPTVTPASWAVCA